MTDPRAIGWTSRLPLVLVLLSLGALALIPILVQRTVAGLRSEITDIGNPARALVTEIQLLLALETTGTRAYLLSGDERYLAGSRGERARRVRSQEALLELTRRYGPQVHAAAVELLERIGPVDALHDSLYSGLLRPSEYLEYVDDEQARFAAATLAAAHLDRTIARASAARAARMSRVQRIGIALSVLVVALALVAALAVARLGERYRSLVVRLDTRAREQVAMREVARRLSASMSVREAGRTIMEGAMVTTRAFGAFLERAEVPEPGHDVEIIATAGEGTPPPGTRVPYPGSLTERIIESGKPQIVTETGANGERMADDLRESCRGCSGLVVPLTVADRALGALVLFRGPGQGHFTPAEVDNARTLGDLASTAIHRVHLLESIRESEARFRLIAEHLDEVIWLADPELRTIDYINPAFERIWGRSWESARRQGRMPVEPVHPEDRDRLTEALRGMRHGEQEVEFRIIRADGEVRWIWSRSYPIRDEQGQVFRIAGIMDDITERKRAEEEIATRVRQLDALADLGQRALVETDLDALFAAAVDLVASRLDAPLVELLQLLAAEQDLLLRAGTGWENGLVGRARIGYGKGSMAGYTLLSAEPVIVRDLRTETRFRPSWLLERHGVVSGISVVIQGRERPWGALGAHTTEPREFSGDDVFFLQSVANILGQAIELRRTESERSRSLEREKEARAEADRRRAELERVTESRSRLMRGFSHDVKNPLGAADGQLQLLEQGIVDGHLSDKQQESVTRARRSIGAALDLIADLLDIARTETEEVEIEREPTDVGQAARETAEEHRARAEAAGLDLTVEIRRDLPRIRSDRSRIRQILGNLLSNAVKYTKHGGITVRAEVREEARAEARREKRQGRKGPEPGVLQEDTHAEARREGRTGPPGPAQAPGPGRWIAVDVSDTGPGIPEKDQELIFQEFGRAERPTTERSAGVGLAISRRIARTLDGDISVRSEVGQGSTFTLWLPL